MLRHTEIKGVFVKGQKFVWPHDTPSDALKQIFTKSMFNFFL